MEPVPEQDLRFGDPESPPTPWTDVVGVLENAELFWISTVRSDGRPSGTTAGSTSARGARNRRR
jgi:hypothetical protein